MVCMALDLRLQQKLSQQLVMTPQLQQAIKLLQLNHLELADVLREEMAENPVLEERAENHSEDQFDTSLGEVAGAGEGNEAIAPPQCAAACSAYAGQRAPGHSVAG